VLTDVLKSHAAFLYIACFFVKERIILFFITNFHNSLTIKALSLQHSRVVIVLLHMMLRFGILLKITTFEAHGKFDL